MNHAHEIVGTHGGALLQEHALEQNPSCVSAFTLSPIDLYYYT